MRSRRATPRAAASSFRAVDPADQSATSTPGARLAAERERQGLSRADIAQRLHMSASQIEAIESGD